MALDNPAFSRNSAFSQQGAVAAAQDVSAQQLQEMYNQPATLPDREVMTVENTVAKTAGAFAVLVVFAAVGWLVTPAMPWLFWGASIIGFVLALVNIFKKEPSPAADPRLRGGPGRLPRRHLADVRDPVGGNRRPGRDRHARGGRRDPRALRERQDPRVEAGHEDLPHRDGRLPRVLAHQPDPHVDGREQRPVGSPRRRHLRHPARPHHRRARDPDGRRTRSCSTST